jgi:uncharacterized membrane protein YgdD (TMEM256/DUF423 family)
MYEMHIVNINLFKAMSKHTLQKQMIRAGAAILSASIALGAIGTHFIQRFIPVDHMNTYKTGIEYMMIHGLGILLIASLLRRLHESTSRNVFFMFIAGIVIFTGTLILLSTRTLWIGDAISWLGMITPIGGALMIGGWALLAMKGYKKPTQFQDGTTERL